SYGGATETVQSLLRHQARPAGRTVLVTQGVHGPGGRLPEIRSVAQAGIWGLVRTSAPEHPELNIAAIDLDPEADRSSLARCILNLLRDVTDENQIAFDGGDAYAARLLRAAPDLLPAAAR